MSRFKQVAEELRELTETWEARLRNLPYEIVSVPRNRQNRTIKEIVGHMVDSATNNTHRIVHLQYQGSPLKYPDYANLGNNDRWIAIQDYQHEDWMELVDVWAASQRHFAHVITRVDEAKLENFWISALGDSITLNEMILDFPRHFKLHLQEISQLIEQH
jgi:uncharacterized damage-inducible protein DinB